MYRPQGRRHTARPCISWVLSEENYKHILETRKKEVEEILLALTTNIEQLIKGTDFQLQHF